MRKSFNTKFWPQWKDPKNGLQVKEILALICNVVALSLGWNYVKGLKVIKIFKEINFEGIWCELEAKNCFQRQSLTKYLREPLVFMSNSFLFFRCFWLVLKRFSGRLAGRQRAGL